MSFVSINFALLVVVTLALYYWPSLRRFQVLILVLASLVFYAWDQWKLLPLLLVAVAITYRAMLGAIGGSRLAAGIGITANLLILCLFKYKLLVVPDPSEFESSNKLVEFFVTLPLPIGISFFVFHNISLIADYFKYGSDRTPPTRLQVLLYILFFPQLVSGPITRAKNFLPQIEAKRLLDVPWLQAGQLLILGLFFKLFCANNLAQATAAMSPASFSGLAGGDRLFLLFAYSFQIYADFFGYSALALGLALLFGYRLPVNFRLPYTARSFADFWHRWHISLSLWLRQYLYVPLGGNRMGRGRTYVNLMTVMVLGGLWHGASLSYAVWGFAHGLLLATERFGREVLERAAPNFRFNVVWRGLYAGLVFVCVSLCWLLFRFQEFSDAASYTSRIIEDPLTTALPATWYYLTICYMSPVLLQHAFGRRLHATTSKHKLLVGVVYGTMLWLSLAERGADTPFIYFRF